METIIWIILQFCVDYANWLTISLGIIVSIISWYIAKKHHSEQLRSYVPSIWTSLGIFFTFLSIYVTLSSMASTSDDHIQITEIIRGIIPAFSTSVIGILGAIVTSYIDRLQKSFEEAKDNINLENFSSGKFSAIGKEQTPDIILLQLIREISNNVSTLISSTEETTNVLNNNVMHAIEENTTETATRTKEALQEQKNQLKTYIEKFVLDANNTHQKQIEDLLSKFNADSDNREKNHIGLLREFAETARTNNDLIKESLCKEAESRQTNLENFIKEEKSELKTFIESQNKMMGDALSQSNITINSAVETISTLFETKIMGDIEQFAKACYEKSEQVLNDQENSNAEYLKQLSGVLQTTHTSLINDINSLKDAVILHLNKLNEENEQSMSKILNQHTTDFHTVSENIHNLDKEYLTSLTKEIENLYTNLDSRTEKLEKEHLKNVERIHQESEEKIKVADEALKEEISRMIGNIQELRASIESSSNSYISKHDEIKKQISDTTTQLINEMSKRFSDSAQIKAIKEASLSLNEKLQITIKALDQKNQLISNSIENVAIQIENFAKVADDTKLLNEYVHSTIDLYKKHSNTMKALEVGIEEMTDTINNALNAFKNASLNSKQDAKRTTSGNSIQDNIK
jgi:hypothetical protein